MPPNCPLEMLGATLAGAAAEEVMPKRVPVMLNQFLHISCLRSSEHLKLVVPGETTM